MNIYVNKNWGHQQGRNHGVGSGGPLN